MYVDGFSQVRLVLCWRGLSLPSGIDASGVKSGWRLSGFGAIVSLIPP